MLGLTEGRTASSTASGRCHSSPRRAGPISLSETGSVTIDRPYLDEPKSGIMQLMSMGLHATGVLVLLAVVGCQGTSPQATVPTNPAGSSAALSSTRTVATPSPNVQALCGRLVPDSQHAVPTTVGQVRRSSLGLVGPPPRVANFAQGEGDEGRAAFCYRWLPDRHLDEWWGASYSGASVRIGGFGDVKQDLGVFDGRAFD